MVDAEDKVEPATVLHWFDRARVDVLDFKGDGEVSGGIWS